MCSGKPGNQFKDGIGATTRILLVVVALFCTLHVSAHPHHSRQGNMLLHGVKTSHPKALTKPSRPEFRSETPSAVIQSEYLFDGNIDDESGDYQLSIEGLGTEGYESSQDGSAFVLKDRSWIQIPQSLHDNIQLDKSLSISIDFMFKDTGVDESVRVILSNKDWAYDVYGLKIEAFNEKVEWQPDGIIFVQFNLGVGRIQVAQRFFNLSMDEWHTATVDLDFENETVTFGINGRTDTQPLFEDEAGDTVDPEAFLATMAAQAFRIGTHYSPEGQEPDWRDEASIASGNTTTTGLAEVLVDNFIIQSPKADGDVSLVIEALEGLTGHVSGSATSSQVQVAAWLTQLRQNLEGTDLTDFASQAKAFVDAHVAAKGALYTIEFRNNLDDTVYDTLPDESKAYVDLGVWMLDGGLTTANAQSAAGIVYTEHTQWPGALAEGAQRVTGGTSDVRAQFVRDPAYLMGGMKQVLDGELAAYLYRPTGFYAPAGETVSVTVDPSLVNSGLHIRVGAHADNHQLLTSTSRFPRLSVDYRIEDTTFDVINPFGGNIYVLVPQDLDLGWTEMNFTGAVRAPYFSTREGYETSEADWPTIRQYPGTFTDFESDKFMITVPTAQLQNFDEPKALLDRWDEIMDLFQVLHGRPAERSRAEAYLLDASQVVVGSFPGGYPVTPGLYAEGENGITDGYYSPFAALIEGTWEEDEGLSIMLHELGHHHYGRFVLEGGQESYVNVPAAAVFNQIFGLSFDDALSHSGYQRFTRDDAAIDWMLTDNFRNGNPMGYDPTTGIIENSYQARGHARYVDLADIYGSWDALSKIYEMYYQEDQASGLPPPTQVEVTSDDFLLKGSRGLGCNLASLFHFWGVHPTDEASTELSDYPVCDGAEERIIHYLDNAPRTLEELEAFHQEKTAYHENQLTKEVYATLLTDFDTTYGQTIRDVGTALLTRYFGTEADAAPSVPVINTTVFNLDPNAGNDVHFAWSGALDPEGKSLRYSWVLKRTDTNEVLLSRNWLTETSVTISAEDIETALGAFTDAGVTVPLSQQVTTSDTFTLVQSELTSTSFTALPDSDGDGLSDEMETTLGTDPQNRDSDSDGQSDGMEVAVGSNPLDFGIINPSDLLGNGRSDIIWQNAQTGDARVWSDQGEGMQFYSELPQQQDLNWQLLAQGPFTEGGGNDLLWRNKASGALAVWSMAGENLDKQINLQTVSNLSWQIIGTGDFDGDGVYDIFWRNLESGGNILWTLTGEAQVAKLPVRSVANTKWEIAQIGDFTGDGKADLLWRNSETGHNIIWEMDGADRVRSVSLDRVRSLSWEIVASGDYDNDGDRDLMWRNNQTGGNIVWLMDGVTRTNLNLRTVRSVSWEVAASGDYDGDGVSDLLWRNQGNGANIIWYLDGGGGFTSRTIGTESDTGWQPVK